MTRSIARFGLLAAAMPLLAGCIDMTQSVTVNADGTATVGVEMVVAAEAFPMMFEGGEEEFCPDELPEGLPPGFTAEVARSSADGAEVCTMTATGPLDELAAFLAEGGLMPDDGEGAPVTTLTPEGGGVYLYELTYTITDEDAAMPFDPNDPNLPPEAMEILTMLEGHYITWEVTAPRIIETDGELEGNTARHQLPLIDMVTGAGAWEHSFTVRFATN